MDALSAPGSAAGRDLLLEESRRALRDLVDDRDQEAALMRAYELGRRALAGGLGVLDAVSLQARALGELLAEEEIPRRGRRVLDAAQAFLLECLSPFEMTRGGLREANAALRRLNEALELEAQRIAHALHDEAGQLVASVHLALAEVARGLPRPAQLRLDEVHRLLEQVEGELRRLSHELRPTALDDLGLFPALETLAAGVARRANLDVSVEGDLGERLPPPVEIALYRIAQEALNNVARHARAGRARVRLERERRLVRCVIADDGVGFDVEEALRRAGAGGLGLIGIRERADAVGGALCVRSTPGAGTWLAVEIPLPREEG